MDRLTRLVALCATGALAAVASSQTITSFTLNHGSSSYGESVLIGPGTASNGGTADFRLGAAPDHLFQNWWWYNTSLDTREYTLGKQTSGSASGNHARLVYTEDAGPLVGALLFDLEYTLTEISAETALVQIGWKVHNLSSETLGVNFFSYADFDLGGTAGGDSGVFIAPNQMQVSDATSSYQAGYIASSTALVGWEQGPFASILNRLTDGVLDNLANASTPFGPGDWTGGYQWQFALAPNGSPGGADQMVGSVVKYVTVPEPASMLALASGVALLFRRRRKA